MRNVKQCTLPVDAMCFGVMIAKWGAKKYALLLMKGHGPPRNMCYVKCTFVLVTCNHIGATYTMQKKMLSLKPQSMWLARLSAGNAIDAPPYVMILAMVRTDRCHTSTRIPFLLQ